jgi:hypothetical protein
MDGIKLTKLLAAIGSILLLACVIWTAFESKPPVTSAACYENLKNVLTADAPTAAKDSEGTLRIAGVYPSKVSMGSQLCVVVAGVTAAAASTPTSPLVDVMLYLNNERASLSEKANPVPGPQMLIYKFGEHTDPTSDTGKFWRSLLAGKTSNGTMALSVGVSKTASSSPSAVSPTLIDFIIYNKQILWLGVVAVAVLIAAFIVFAACSTVIRDTPSMDPNTNKPNGTFSLGRTQMAVWLVLTTAGFIFLWLTLGFYVNVITTSVLVLLGINTVTGLAAVVLDKPAANAANPPAAATTQGFWEDLVCDATGAKLQRIQMIVWTCILAVIFIWNAAWNFVFVNFDTNLLLLMGIAGTTYLGFKSQEK